MNLITPDTGLLFWMVIIFGLLFFILAKFGFPIITSMVEERNAAIDKSLKDAEEVEAMMVAAMKEHDEMIAEVRRAQSEILKEATEAKNTIIRKAREEARAESDKILSEARVQIAAEKESALRDIRKEVAILAVSVSEKILREQLSSEAARKEYLDRLIDEAGNISTDIRPEENVN
ncbi:MAG: F0F1 ATP synthase subunit B [Bacteroidales bacterium]|nr:F0F1 ATP synthase subunit B [Bacteroidales bacterium]